MLTLKTIDFLKNNAGGLIRDESWQPSLSALHQRAKLPIKQIAGARAIRSIPRDSPTNRTQFLGLGKSDLDARVARFPMTKNGTPRTIPLLSSCAIEVFKELKKDAPCKHKFAGYMLWRYAIDRDYLKHAWVLLTKHVGVEGLRFHDLRRGGVSRMLEKG